MKKHLMRSLALALMLSLLLTGCASKNDTNASASASASADASSAEVTPPDIQEPSDAPDASSEEEPSISSEAPSTPDSPIPSDRVVPGEDQIVSSEGESGEDLALGKQRITYSSTQSGVVYVTSADQLPDLAGLEEFDDAYFADHALVLVTETVASGGIAVGISSIDIVGNQATVTLSHTVPEGDLTDDMATWVLWAQVDAGLDCQWSLANPAMPTDAVKS
jgi:hypothetical protein